MCNDNDPDSFDDAPTLSRTDTLKLDDGVPVEPADERQTEKIIRNSAGQEILNGETDEELELVNHVVDEYVRLEDEELTEVSVPKRDTYDFATD
jgi:hypothetical protein